MNRTRVLPFLGCLGVLVAFFILRLMFSHGATFGNYFLSHDWGNTSMDFFNPLFFFEDDDPYSSNSNYPALCACVFKFFRLFLPDSAPVLPVNSPTDSYDLRVFMPAQLIYIVYSLFCLSIAAYSMLKMTESADKRYRVAICVAVAFSGPVLFALERGNLVLLAFALTFFFVSEYKSVSKRMRWVAYAALAFAVGLKVYPCVFLLLVFKDNRKEFFGACILTLLVFFLPFFAFDGFESIGKMISGMSASTDEQLARGLGHQYSFSFLLRDIAAFVGIRLEIVPVMFQGVALIICLVLFFVVPRDWMKVFALSLACVWVPNFAATYTLLFFIIPTLMFFMEADRCFSRGGAVVEAACSGAFAIILAPLGFPRVAQKEVLVAWGDAVSPLTWGELAVYAAIVLILCVLLAESVRTLIRNRL